MTIENKKVVAKKIVVPLPKMQWSCKLERFPTESETLVEIMKERGLDPCKFELDQSGLIFVPVRQELTTQFKVEDREILVGGKVPYHTEYFALKPVTLEANLVDAQQKTDCRVRELFVDNRKVGDCFVNNDISILCQEMRNFNTRNTKTEEKSTCERTVGGIKYQFSTDTPKKRTYEKTIHLIMDGTIGKLFLDHYAMQEMPTDAFISLYKSIAEKAGPLYLSMHQGQIVFPQARLWTKKPELKNMRGYSKEEGLYAFHADWHENRDIAIAEAALGKKSKEKTDWFFRDVRNIAPELTEKYRDATQQDLDSIAREIIKDNDPVNVIKNQNRYVWAPNILIYKLD